MKMIDSDYKKKSDEIILELKKTRPWIEEHEANFKDYPGKGRTVAILEGQKINEYYLWKEKYYELEKEVNQKRKVIPEIHFCEFVQKRITELKAWVFTDSEMGEPILSSAHNEILSGDISFIWDFFDNIYNKVWLNNDTLPASKIELKGVEFKYKLYSEGLLITMSEGIAYAYHISNLENEFPLSKKEGFGKNHSIDKLKWKCSPSILAHLITELAKKGFIEYPLHNGDPNYTGLGRLCYQIFDIKSTEKNFSRECNPKLNSLSETKKSKFSSLPDLNDLD